MATTGLSTCFEQVRDFRADEKVVVQALDGCIFLLFFVVSEFMFSLKAAIFFSVDVSILTLVLCRMLNLYL